MKTQMICLYITELTKLSLRYFSCYKIELTQLKNNTIICIILKLQH